MKKPFAAVATLLALATIGISVMAPAVEAKTVAKKKVIKKHISVSMIPGKDEKDFTRPDMADWKTP